MSATVKQKSRGGHLLLTSHEAAEAYCNAGGRGGLVDASWGECEVEPVAATTTRVSVASDGTQGDAQSYLPAISADGRFVAFQSDAANLVPGDTNGVHSDVFVHDRQTGTTERVSVASDGTQGDSSSRWPAISADGRIVAFDSYAANLVSGDTNGGIDVFVHDRQTGTTERVSVASDGTQGDGSSRFPAISADGRFVAFESGAGNLVPGDTGEEQDTFVHDRQTGTTELVDVASNGTQGDRGSEFVKISADGRFVVFTSYSTNLVPDDTNTTDDIFVHDRDTGATERVSIASDGTEGDGGSYGISAISADGRVVAFYSDATNLVPGDANGVSGDDFVRDRQTGTTERVSVASDGTQGDTGGGDVAISADGRFVAFTSGATNLVLGDTNGGLDIFVHDRQTGATERVSVASDGTEGSGSDYWGDPAISADGRFVAFDSRRSDLVPGDTNGFVDVFVRDRGIVP